MTDITRDSAVLYMQQLMRDPINALGKWASDNDPTGAASSYSPGPLTPNMLPGQTVSSSPLGSEITSTTDIIRTEVCNVLRNAAVILSRCRNVRLVKTSYPYSSNFFDVTQATHMNAAYQISSGSLPADVPAGDISYATLTAFVDSINTIVTNHRNTTLTFVEYYCHSNCHSNHSSRGRR